MIQSLQTILVGPAKRVLALQLVPHLAGESLREEIAKLLSIYNMPPRNLLERNVKSVVMKTFLAQTPSSSTPVFLFRYHPFC
jgi:hypothetical protein